MPDIDRWVIRHAFAALRTLPPGVMFSINLSGASLSQDGLLEFVRHEMRENGIVPEYVCFEITETAAIAGFDEALGLIEALRTDGCRFSLDDFGTGLSSFGYLKTLPVDFLKIDGSFVRGMRRDSLDHAVVEAVNNIAHVLGKRTVAEFVESPEILQRLHELGVDYAQGYAVERPQPIESLYSGSAVEA
jgi:EAL domain-containing protein (putative c-di-GMP-specific phosphodiesterase class I)